MKIFFLFLSLSFATLSWASNPLIRNCRLAGGEFFVVTTDSDELPLCQFGNSYVGALDVMNYSLKLSSSESLLAFLLGEKLCSGKKIEVKELHGPRVLTLCEFGDQSLIDMTTLQSGIESRQNQALLNFLKSK